MKSSTPVRRPRTAHHVRPAAALLAGLVIASVPGAAHAATASLTASGLTSPSGAVWLPDAVGGGHLWVADHLQGFCRIDAGGIAIATCVTSAVSPGQPSFDPTTNMVYLPDNAAKGVGVVRLGYDPATESFVDSVVVAPQAGLAGNRPTASALGPDGNLYIGYLKNGNVSRVVNPAGATQTVQSVGSTSDSRRPGGFAFRGTDLYIAEGAAVTRMANATSTACTGGCRATTIPGLSVPAPLGIGYDPVGDRLFIGTTSSVQRYGVATRLQDTLAVSGTYPDGTSIPSR